MLKQRIITVIAGIALLMAVAGASGLTADWLNLEMTPAAYACGSGGSSGGDC